MKCSTLLPISIAVVLCLPSCEGFKDVPLKARVATDYGTIGYSSKSGLEVQVDQRSRK